MGKTFSSIHKRFFRKAELRILMLGLDASGKTTILYKLELGKISTTIPTIGYNLQTIKHKNVLFTICDVGGGSVMRRLWKSTFTNPHGLIFVVDSEDKERIEEARDELMELFEDNQYKDRPLLVLANKQDLLYAMNTEEITEKLELELLDNLNWKVQATSGVLGRGLREGLDWLSSQLIEK